MAAVSPIPTSPSGTSFAAPEPDELARAVLRVLPTLFRLICAEMHAAPHTAGMNLAQFRALARLQERDYRAAELAAALGVGRSTLSATSDALVRRGLVERRNLADDRRGVLLRLTPAGHALYRALEARAVSGLARLLTETSQAERSALELGLAALRRCLQEAGLRLLPREKADELLENGE